MQEVLNSSLGIYWAGYLFIANLVAGVSSKEVLILSIVCFVIGWFTYAPRNGGEFGGRFLWYVFSGCYALILLVSEPMYNMAAWYFFMGVMLKFSFEILYNNATP
jgi:hypothetical protein